MMKSITTVAIGAALAFVVGSMPALADGMSKGSKAAAAQSYGGGCDNRFNGFYAGVHGAFATLESRLTDRDLFGTEVTHDESSIAIGGSVGFNVQNCSVVWGVVADLSFADLGSSENYLNNTVNISRSTDWYGSVRTRLGFAIEGLMLYTTGGIAWADFATTGTLNGIVPPLSVKLFDDTRLGWVGGVGTEYAYSDRISIVSEALYYDFGTEKTSVDPLNTGTSFRFDDHPSMWVTRIGINIKLGDRAQSYEPLK